MLHPVYGMNSPLISPSLIRHSLLHFLLSHMAGHHFHHLHHLHYHCLRLLLLAQYFILNPRLGSSTNSFVHRPFFPTGLITRTLGPCNDLTLLNGCTGKCVRLSRLLVGFRMHFKSLHFHSFHSFHSFSQFQSSAFVENYTVFQKSDAKIQITITTAYLTRIKYPLSRFNYHLSGVNVANFNKIHRTVSEQQLF